MTLRRRLLLAQAPLAVALLLVGAAAVRTVTALGESSENILKDNYRSVLAAQRMAAALDRLDGAALLRATGRGPGPDAAAERDRLEAELRVQEGNVTEPGEADATRRLRAAWDGYRRVWDEAGGASDPMAAYLDRVQGASGQVRAATDEVLDLNQDAMVRKSNQARRAAKRLLELMLAATAAALLAGLLVSMTLTARLVRPLTALTQAVRRFGEGDLEARARPQGRDEIAGLGREFDTMADRLEQYRRSSLGDLLQAQQAAQAAIDSLPDPVLVLDPGGRVLSLNQAGSAVLGAPPGEGAGRSIQELEPPLRERLEAAHQQVLAGRGPVVPRGLEEAVAVDRPGGQRRLLPRASALRSAEGTVSGVTVVLQDVTRLVRFDELKNDLVATVAHEFRTPLTSLRMAIHLCAEEAAGPLTTQQADLLGAARQDCERLQAITDDILDLSRIQAGRIELQPRELDARDLAARALAGQAEAARAAGVALEGSLPEAPVPVRADPERLEVVLANLLGNALRHARAGGKVELRVAAAPGGARLEVLDDGPGVPPELRERIFERFFQAPGARRGGIGLGLYISREIVQAHGGRIGVEDAPGGGACFWLTLPAP